MSHPSLRLSQNHQIYHQLGLILWANRQSAVRMLRSDVPAAVSLQQNEPKQETVSIADQLASMTAVKQLAKQSMTSPSAPSSSVITAPDTKLNQGVIKSSDTVRFELQAISYRSYIMLLDVLHLDASSLAVWQSLMAAISQSADSPVVTHQLSYPMMMYDSAQDDSSLLIGSVMGFFYGIHRQNTAANQLIIFNELPKAIEITAVDGINQIITDFSIEQMVHDANVKKQFWQLLHSSADA